MKNVVQTLSGLCLSLFLCWSAQAGQTFTYPTDEPVFSITFPDSWETKVEDDTLIATTADEAIEINLWAMDSEDLKGVGESLLEQAAGEVDGIIDEWVKDFKLSSTDSFELQGMQFIEVTGSGIGVEDGEPLTVAVDFFSPDSKNLFVLMYWGEPDAEKKHLDDMKAIVQSIKTSSE